MVSYDPSKVVILVRILVPAKNIINNNYLSLKKRGCRQAVKTPVFGTDIRVFESRQPRIIKRFNIYLKNKSLIMKTYFY